MEEHPQARAIVETLNRAGFVAYYAGGWVRDYLLQHPSDDIDIATNAPPETIQALFPHTVPIGIAFGIILVLIDGHQYEVATFRQDFDYHDGRRPTRISFSTAEEDAKRRDFTINGMFFDPIHGTLLDYVGGRLDLQAKILRAIGNPHDRIKEDRLRMIRAIRMACRFDLTIEEKTQEAIRAHAKELFPSVAIERVVQELHKGLAFGHLQAMLSGLQDYGLLASIFPELEGLTSLELKERLKPTFRYPKETPLIAYLLPLFLGHTLSRQLDLCKSLKLPNQDQQFVSFLFRMRQAENGDDAEWAQLYANPFSPLCLQILWAHLQNEKGPLFLQSHERRREKLREAIERIERRDPVVKATDLQKAGVLPGPAMGLLLKEAEKISCNEQIYDAPSLIERLRKSPIWPSE